MREAQLQLRRWCRYAKTHQDVDEVWCNWSFCGTGSRNPARSHRLRKRRMLVCSVCQQGYFKKREFDAHECYSAY